MHVNDDHTTGNTNFSVARVSRNLGEASSIGVIGTYGNAVSQMENVVGGIDVKLATSKFRKNKNLSLILFGLKSNTKGLTDHDKSWGATFSYPNDYLYFNIGHHEIGENFVAGMGFVPRTNIKESYGNIKIGPRPNKWGLMQVYTGIGFDHIVNFSNILQTRSINIAPIYLRFKSGEELSWSLSQNTENLEKAFNIFSTHVIPIGQYQFYRNTLNFLTAGSRNFAVTSSYVWGNFYNGSRKDFNFGVNYKVAVPFFLGVKYKQNDVSLPDGNFTARIYQMNANILFSPSVTLYNYLQYDNYSKTIGIQSRFQWIIVPGNEIYIVWTSSISQPLERYVMTDNALRFKIKYNIRF